MKTATFLLCAALVAIGPCVHAAPVEAVHLEEHHSRGRLAASIILPLLASIALSVGAYFGYRRVRHHFKYKRVLAQDGETQTLTMELPNHSAVYEKVRGQTTEFADKTKGQALELTDKARESAREYGDKAREYGDKARGYFKVPDTTGVRSTVDSFLARFKKVKATDEEQAKLEFELPASREKKEESEESSEEEEDDEEEEQTTGKPLLEGKNPKWGTESKKAELKTAPGAPQAAYDPVPTRAPTKTTATRK